MKRTLSFERTEDGSRSDGRPIACGLASFFARDPEGPGIVKTACRPHKPKGRVPFRACAMFRNLSGRLLSSFHHSHSV